MEKVAALLLAVVALGNAQGTPPTMNTVDGDLHIAVDGANKIMLTTGDMTVVPSEIPGMIDDVKNYSVEKIGELDMQVQQGFQDLMGYIDMVNKSLSDDAMELSDNLKMAIANLENDTTTRLDALDSKVAEDLMDLKTELTSAISDAKDSLEKSITKVNMTATDAATTATENAADIKAVMADVKARTECLALGHKWNAEESKCQNPHSHVQVSGVANGEFRLYNGGIWETAFSFMMGRKSPNKWMKLTFSDNIGWYTHYRAHTTACRWRILVNGKEYREHWSHSFYADGWRLEPVTMFNWYDPAPKWYEYASQATTFEVQQYRDGGASECRVGWGGGRHIMMEEQDTDLVAVRRYMRDTRPSVTSFRDIVDRSITYTPKDSASKLVVTYSDTIGTYYWSWGSASGCSTRLLVNNQAIDSNQYTQHVKGDLGWRIFPMSMSWTVDAKYVTKGQKLTIKLQNLRRLHQCLYGWSNSRNHNTFTVEEISAERQKNMATTATKSLTEVDVTNYRKWTDVAKRTVKYTKKDANSIVKVTLADNIGYEHNSHSTACRYRVLANGKEYEMSQKVLHGTPRGGWQLNPNVMVWVCKTCPKGALTFQVQVYRDSGARRCRFGWGGGSGYFSVEEIQAPEA